MSQKSPKPAESTVLKFSLGRKSPDADSLAPSVAELEARLLSALSSVRWTIDQFLQREERVSFREFERALMLVLMAIGRAGVALFFALREQGMISVRNDLERNGRLFRPGRAQPRGLTTIFGVVRYWRIYMRSAGRRNGSGFHPLDVDLGLTADRISWNVFSLSARLATKLSFAEARATLSLFVPNTPSVEVIEQAVLGLGRHTQAWFIESPAPEGDGDVLVVMIDGKCIPTATEEELKRRRGKRKKRKQSRSPRHRGRNRRARHPKKRRRKKGDKSKNGRQATVLVMYTLKREGDRLVGPINKWVYASFAPKRHAFEVARREADKRGFTEGSGKLMQIMTDGDDDLAYYAKELFPNAIHSIDIIHVVEKLWSVGQVFFREGSTQLQEWVDGLRRKLYQDKVGEIIDELRDRFLWFAGTARDSPGKRKRFIDGLRYLESRRTKLNYGTLLAQDLEISSGPVEGAVKHVIGKRCDHGGMRWIRERSEALVQLRCIEINGHWDAFSEKVHDTIWTQEEQSGSPIRLQTQAHAALPQVKKAA